MNETLEYFRLLDRVANTVQQLPRRAAVLAVQFSKERFVSQNWVDTSTEPWKKRKPGWSKKNDKGRAILVQSGRLKRSIRTVRVTPDEAVIGTDRPGAAAHNFGFRGRVNQKVSKHTRRTRSGRTATVKAHDRTIHQNIPQRQFIGASAVLDRQLTRMMTAEIIKSFK